VVSTVVEVMERAEGVCSRNALLDSAWVEKDREVNGCPASEGEGDAMRVAMPRRVTMKWVNSGSEKVETAWQTREKCKQAGEYL
jgi:hypothetical protein